MKPSSTHKIFLVALASFFLVVSATVRIIAAKIVVHPVMHIRVKVPDNWTVTVNTGTDLVMVPTPKIATVSISYYLFDQQVTPSAIQYRRVGPYFDGWVQLFSRGPKPNELARSRAQDSLLVVYGKPWIDESMLINKRIVMEHYFLRGLRGYVISIDTIESNWTKIDTQVRDILESFVIQDISSPHP